MSMQGTMLYPDIQSLLSAYNTGTIMHSPVPVLNAYIGRPSIHHYQPAQHGCAFGDSLIIIANANPLGSVTTIKLCELSTYIGIANHWCWNCTQNLSLSFSLSLQHEAILESLKSMLIIPAAVYRGGGMPVLPLLWMLDHPHNHHSRAISQVYIMAKWINHE